MCLCSRHDVDICVATYIRISPFHAVTRPGFTTRGTESAGGVVPRPSRRSLTASVACGVATQVLPAFMFWIFRRVQLTW